MQAVSKRSRCLEAAHRSRSTAPSSARPFLNLVEKAARRRRESSSSSGQASLLNLQKQPAIFPAFASVAEDRPARRRPLHTNTRRMPQCSQDQADRAGWPVRPEFLTIGATSRCPALGDPIRHMLTRRSLNLRRSKICMPNDQQDWPLFDEPDRRALPCLCVHQMPMQPPSGVRDTPEAWDAGCPFIPNRSEPL
jgi:hypothetical protein